MALFGQSVGLANDLAADTGGAVVGAGDASCGGLFIWDADQGVQPIKLTLGSGNGWAMDSYFRPAYRGPECARLGVTFSPTLSPDGTHVAFALKDIPGVSGVATRLEAPADIYIADRQWTEAHRLSGGIRDLRSLSWSPTGERLAFAGSYRDKEGIWMVSAHTGSIELVSNLAADSVAWSPDGSRLCAVVHQGSPAESTAMFLVELPKSPR